MDAYKLASALNKHGIRIGVYSPTLIRLVTHYGITSEDIKYVVEVIDSLLS